MMKTLTGFEKGVGMGSWLTNYKRSRLLTYRQIELISPGDWEHFDSFLTREDFQRVAGWGMDHVRLPFDQDGKQLTDEEAGQILEELRQPENGQPA